MKTPIVSAVIVHFGPLRLLQQLLGSLAAHPDRTLIHEIIIVDNGPDATRLELEPFTSNPDFPPARVVANPHPGYASGVNRGANTARGDVLLIANNDVAWSGGSSIRSLLTIVSDPAIGVAGPQLVYPDGGWQRSYGTGSSVRSALASVLMLDSLGHLLARRRFRTGKSGDCKSVGYVVGAFMCIRRDCFDQLGGFDERYSFYGEDADFCFRARRAGWAVLSTPTTQMVHLGGASSSQTAPEEYDRRLLHAKMDFVRKHYGDVHAVFFGAATRLALWERAFLYGAIARLRPTETWRSRAEAAALRLSAARSMRRC